ncbi:P-loop NTPase fold protein [Salinicola sp. JS01]|uniref:KAP family P-loop NTPase fold protein n=1 Tax=Salinicola sp. JS01 TaxID=3050071 RepID=UPI00255B760C|nr:P-loop NTPase fold protein [Salinicola sp. JS01]WIX31550.1 P-loop NTPase fold protein [Salinicola sp. JS01]
MTKLLASLWAWLARQFKKSASKGAGVERTNDEIGTEVPIRNASQDRLRRVGFADRIACILSELSPREGRVFAIRGGWGFGKSSLKNLIIERLGARNDGAKWLDFNPWQWGDSDAIARALFGQIADRLGSEYSGASLARAEALRRYGAILNGSSAPLKKAGDYSSFISATLTNVSVIAIASTIGFDLPTAAMVATCLALLSVGASLLGRVLSYFGRDRSGDALDKVREALEIRLRELDRPLVVFVDDIDRLEPEQIRMLLRQVKVNANLPNIAFVLLFQPSIVEQALAPVADGDGRAFLEKVVQACFDLPAVPVSTVHRIFGEELSELAGPYATEANGFSHTRWGNAFVGCIQPLVRNLRDVRRLISSIAMHIPLHVAGNVFEVNIVDFLVLEALRVFEPDLHETMFRERELLLQESRFKGDGRREVDKVAAERLLETVSERHRSIAQDVLKELFPPLEWAYGGMNYGDGFHVRWLAEKRVCSSRYFPRYFELQTAIGEISERRFVEFLDATASENRLAESLEAIEADFLLPSLAARLDESIDRLPVENAAVLLPGMFRVAQKLVGQGEADPFSSPWVSAWRATSWFLSRIPQDQRGELVLRALCHTKALSVAAILIHLNDPTDQKEDRGEAFDPSLDLDTVESMKAEWLRLIKSLAVDGDVLRNQPDLVSLLYHWKQYSGSLQEPREWVSQEIQSDQAFASLTTRMMSRGMSHSSGDRVGTPRNTFSREVVDNFIGIDVAKTRCDMIDPSDYPEHEEALRTLHRYVELWLGLRESGPLDY